MEVWVILVFICHVLVQITFWCVGPIKVQELLDQFLGGQRTKALLHLAYRLLAPKVLLCKPLILRALALLLGKGHRRFRLHHFFTSRFLITIPEADFLSYFVKRNVRKFLFLHILTWAVAPRLKTRPKLFRRAMRSIIHANQVRSIINLRLTLARERRWPLLF